MAKDTDPMFPRWWNTSENGMYVGISLPTLDGESAKIAAVTNALYSFLHTTGCHIRYMAEIETNEEQEINRVVCKGLEKGFTISILQEYYNSKGEYFVLCAISSDVKSSNAMVIDWYLDDTNSDGSLSVIVEVKAKINRFPFESSMQYEVSWALNSQKYKLNCNGKDFIHNKDIEINDDISDFILGGDIGLTQLRLLTTFPLLTDTISFTSSSIISDESFFSKTLIMGEGKSMPHNIQLSDYSDRGLTFNVHERFPNLKFKHYDDNNITSQITGLSEKYNREYLDSRGNASAIKCYGFCEDKSFEAAKNKSLLRAFSEGVMAVFNEIKSANNTITETIDELNDIKSVSSALTSHKAKIYPLYYLDPNERVDCKEKKYRKEWLDNKNRYQYLTSVVIPFGTINSINH